MTEEEIKALQDELEVTKGERDGLKAEREALTGELENRNTKITELEAVVAERDEKLSSLNDSLSRAVSDYKTLVIKSNPGILEEFITGGNIEAINQSLENANVLIGKVKQGLEAEASRIRIPAGAPQRTLPDLSALSPREKIQYAIGGKR